MINPSTCATNDLEFYLLATWNKPMVHNKDVWPSTQHFDLITKKLEFKSQEQLETPMGKSLNHTGIQVTQKDKIAYSTVNQAIVEHDTKTNQGVKLGESNHSSVALAVWKDIAIEFFSGSGCQVWQNSTMLAKDATDNVTVRPQYLRYSNYGRGVLQKDGFVFIVNSINQIVRVSLLPFEKRRQQPKQPAEQQLAYQVLAQDSQIYEQSVTDNDLYYCTQNNVVKLTFQNLFSTKTNPVLKQKLSVSPEAVSSGSTLTALTSNHRFVLATVFSAPKVVVIMLNPSKLKTIAQTEIQNLTGTDYSNLTPVHCMKLTRVDKVDLAVLVGVYHHLHLVAVHKKRLELLVKGYDITSVYVNGMDVDRSSVYVTGMDFCKRIEIALKN